MNGRGLGILHGMSSMADRLIDAMTKSAPRQYGQERITELRAILGDPARVDAVIKDELSATSAAPAVRSSSK